VSFGDRPHFHRGLPSWPGRHYIPWAAGFVGLALPSNARTHEISPEVRPVVQKYAARWRRIKQTGQAPVFRENTWAAVERNSINPR
jgi:hypothetical protein